MFELVSRNILWVSERQALEAIHHCPRYCLGTYLKPEQEVMTMLKWLFVVLLVLQAYFAASYVVPVDREAQAAFSGMQHNG